MTRTVAVIFFGGAFLLGFALPMGSDAFLRAPSLIGEAHAAPTPDEVLEDPVLEERARAISKELRCLVCQNQSIDDSDADLARDLRLLVRERLLAGDSDDEIIAFATERYGDFVLLRPPVKPSTWLLWYGPPIILVIAVLSLMVYMRRRRNDGDSRQPEALSPDEQAKLNHLLDRRTSSET